MQIKITEMWAYQRLSIDGIRIYWEPRKIQTQEGQRGGGEWGK